MSRQLARSLLSSFHQHSKARHSRIACYKYCIQTINVQQHRHLSSTTPDDDNSNNNNNNNNNNNSSDDEKTKEWIPPSRPLSGDKGQSHLYLKAQQLDDEIDKVLAESEDTSDTNELLEDTSETDDAQFIDLDDLDLEELQKRFESGEFEVINGENGESMDMEDIDIEALIQEIQQMESNFDDDDNDTEKEEDSVKETQEVWIEDEDKFQRHFESQDFLDEPELPPVPVNGGGSGTTTATAAKVKATLAAGAPDWLSTRRAKLASNHASATGIGMMTPSELRNQKSQNTTIPILKHTLLSSSEIMSSLMNDGAKHVKLIEPDEENKSYLGWEGLILATASSYTHIRVLTDSLVHNLRKRGLAERGVIGAKFGAEGGEDPTMSSYARRKRRIGRGKTLDDGWMSVDCRNYIVHVQDDVTRRSVDLEGLWSPDSKEGRLLRRLDPKDEDAVDDYVAANPIPEAYADSMKITGEFFGTDGGRGGYARSSKSKKDIVSGRYTPTNNQKRKVKNRGRFG